MPTIKTTAYSPDGIQYSKCFNSNHYTKEELDEQILRFKQWIQSGKPHKEFQIIKSFKALNPINPPPEEKKGHFENKHISTLKLPENKAMSFAVIGSTRSGKSYALCHIWEKVFKKHITALMTLSGHGDIYKPFHKKAVIVDGFQPELVDEALSINKATKNHYD